MADARGGSGTIIVITFDDMTDAVNEAKGTIIRADAHVAQMAKMVAGKLKSSGTDDWTLKQLKRELVNFDMRTGTWKE